MSLADPLRLDVLAFERPPFALALDLRHLDLVRGAPEAVVLYVARILEALVREAVARLGRRPGPSLLANIYRLQSLDVLDTVERYVVHAIRRLGNEARHVRARLESADGEIAITLLSPLLEWFFLHLPSGPRINGLTRGGGPYRPSRHAAGRAVMDAVINSTRSGAALPAGVLASLDDQTFGPSPGCAALRALAIEALLRAGDLETATRIVDRSLARHPDDSRLAQLQGLVLSRGGRLDEALRVLRELDRRLPGDDETIGVLAGALKRKAGVDAASPWLAEAHEKYAAGWSGSRHANTWLGINAATTALFLGDREQARSIAQEVHDELVGRDTSPEPGSDAPRSYWAGVTRAEALLLLGRIEDAGPLYRAVLAAAAHRPSDLEQSRQQAERILQSLGAGSFKSLLGS